jgi:protein associated with RNAse G/E
MYMKSQFYCFQFLCIFRWNNYSSIKINEHVLWKTTSRSVFKNAVDKSNCVGSNDRIMVTNEAQRTWKVAVLAYFYSMYPVGYLLRLVVY